MRVDLTPADAAVQVRLPPRAIGQALRSLITNAQDASPTDEPVRVTATIDRSSAQPQLRVSVTDRGQGMPPDVLARVGEPFYTTKSPGRGMGLGLYLARAVVEGIGGTLIIESTAGRGTIITTLVPIEIATAEVAR